MMTETGAARDKCLMRVAPPAVADGVRAARGLGPGRARAGSKCLPRSRTAAWRKQKRARFPLAIGRHPKAALPRFAPAIRQKVFALHRYRSRPARLRLTAG